MISVIIPVYREEHHIRSFLADLQQRPDPPSEILVIDGDAKQRTLTAIDNAEIRRIPSLPGRGRQMNLGALHAHGDILLFLHADTALPPNAILRMGLAMRDRDIAGGAFSLRFASSRPSLRTIATLANLRSALTRVPYGDQGIFLRKDIFQRLGGFKEIPIMEDLEFMARLRRSGYRIRILPEAVRTSARRHHTEGVVLCTLRNLCLRLLFHLGVSAWRLHRFYRPNTE